MAFQDMHRQHKIHRNVLYALVVVLVAMQIVSFLVMSSQVVKTGQEIQNVRNNLTGEIGRLNSLIEEYNQNSQIKINNLSSELSSQQSNVQQQITLLKSANSDFSGIVESAVKGVVSVTTQNSLGTGFIITSDGYVVTNEHVVTGAKQIRVTTSSGQTSNAALVGFDANRDIALLKVDGNYPYLQFSPISSVQVGNKVIAIGNPLGLSFTVTEGIVSGLNRAGANGLSEYVQTDVSLNPGNSGGPLIDKSGKVIGINNFKLANSENIGFALESDVIVNEVNAIANRTIV